VSEKHLINEIRSRIGEMDSSHRAAIIIKLIESSDTQRNLIRRLYPEYYQEAISALREEKPVDTNQPYAQVAKTG
jgi:hypothetical protein